MTGRLSDLGNPTTGASSSLAPRDRAGLRLLLIPGATFLALLALASSLTDAAVAAETAYLAVLCAAVLVSAAVLAAPASIEIPILALLIVTVAMVIPLGGSRGAAVSLLLVLALGVSAVQRWRSEPGHVSWRFAVPLAIGVQSLAYSNRWLMVGFDLETIGTLVFLPLGGALAMVVLARYVSAGPALVATAVLVAAAPGWSLVSVLTLLAFAAAAAPVERRTLWFRLVIAAAILAAAVVEEPRFALLLVASVVAFLVPAKWRVQIPLAIVALLATTIVWPTQSWPGMASDLFWLPLLLPALFVAGRRTSPRLASGLAFGAAGLPFLALEPAVAPSLVLISLGLPRHRSSATPLQALWVGTLVAGAVLLAAYPWFRELPLAAALRLMSLEPSWLSALLVNGIAAAGTGLAGLTGQRWRGWQARVSTAILAPALLLIGVGFLLALPATSLRPLDHDVLVLSPDQLRWRGELPPQTTVSRIIVHSYLAESIGLPLGAPVATVRLASRDGRIEERSLRAGVDTGEWAARRADQVRHARLVAPWPWLSWVAPGAFFAQRYRSRHELEAPIEAVSVEIERHPDLASEVSLAVFGLELVQ